MLSFQLCTLRSEKVDLLARVVEELGESRLSSVDLRGDVCDETACGLQRLACREDAILRRWFREHIQPRSSNSDYSTLIQVTSLLLSPALNRVSVLACDDFDTRRGHQVARLHLERRVFDDERPHVVAQSVCM